MADVVNATRMELTRLKNRLQTTRRGHDLLKDKQDEMMRQFLKQINDYKILLEDVSNKWLNILADFNHVKLYHYKDELKEKFLVPAVKLDLSYLKDSIMSVTIPKIKINELSKPKLTYSLYGTHPGLDETVLSLAKVLPDLIKLAVEDKKIRILIKEIEKTKRRVNAIEHLIIPEIVDDIKMVRMKISDAERSNTVRIMKSKEIILKRAKEGK
ncbi:MAG: V-type ATP synthase subunit D [Acholeplasmataceae bacterium]